MPSATMPPARLLCHAIIDNVIIYERYAITPPPIVADVESRHADTPLCLRVYITPLFMPLSRLLLLMPYYFR